MMRHDETPDEMRPILREILGGWGLDALWSCPAPEDWMIRSERP